MSEVIKNVVEFTNNRAMTISRLRKESPYYPEYFKIHEGNQLLLSSLIRKQKDGVWHTVHLVKEFVINPLEFEKAIEMFHSDAYTIIQLHIVFERDEVDKLQITEEERIKKLRNFL